MATRKATKASTEIVRWEEELAAQAQIAADMEEGSGGGQFFSLKSGVLSWGDLPLPGNQMAVIIVDSILENVFYEGEYDPDVPQSPSCFAFGRDDKTMAPHSIVVEAGQQMCGTSGLCAGCEMNEFGSADKGRGKACRNSRRLALIPAGSFSDVGKFLLNDDVDHYKTATVGYMKLPVTSIKGYATFVKQVAAGLRRPPHGVITKIKVVPDPKSQFKVIFEPIMNVPDHLMGAIMGRNKETAAIIDFPYQLNEEEEAPPPKRGRASAAKKAPAKKPAAKARARKY